MPKIMIEYLRNILDGGEQNEATELQLDKLSWVELNSLLHSLHSELPSTWDNVLVDEFLERVALGIDARFE